MIIQIENFKPIKSDDNVDVNSVLQDVIGKWAKTKKVDAISLQQEGDRFKITYCKSSKEEGIEYLITYLTIAKEVTENGTEPAGKGLNNGKPLVPNEKTIPVPSEPIP